MEPKHLYIAFLIQLKVMIFRYRLCVNFENGEGHTVSVDYVFQQSQQFYANIIGRVPPSRETYAKLILKLFRAESTSISNGRLRYRAFKNLKVRENTQNDVVFPEYCTVSTTKDELEIICPTETVCDDKVVNCRIIMKENDTLIDIKNKTYSTGLGFPITQASVNGLLYLTQRMKLCEGKDFTQSMNSKSYITETLSTILNKNNKRCVQRSKACKILLSCLSNHTRCEACIKTFSKAEKRISQTNTNTGGSQQKKPREAFEEVQNASSDNKQNIPKRQPLKEVQNVLKQCSDEDGFKQNENCDDPDTMIKLDESDHDDLTKILESILAEGAPPNFKVLLESQLKNCKKGIYVHQRKWDPKIISVCLSVYLSSPKAYDEWKSSGMLVLPSKRLLQFYKNTVRQTPGFNQENLTWMTKEATAQNISDFGRHGGLVIDEMTIQDDLVIERRGDTWHLVGVLEMGETNNNIEILCKQTKKVQLATHALQFVFHGLTGFR